MAEREKWIGIGVAGLGAGILGYAAYKYYVKKKLIDDYIAETAFFRDTLLKAYADGKVDEGEALLLGRLQDELKRKERLITELGFWPHLIKALWITLGITIAYSAYKITSRVFDHYQRKYRPPGYICDVCGAKFTTEEELRKHLERYAVSKEVVKYDILAEALKEAPTWFIALVADRLGWAYKGLEDLLIRWHALSTTEKILYGMAIALVILLIVSFAAWLGFIPVLKKVILAARAIFLV